LTTQQNIQQQSLRTRQLLERAPQKPVTHTLVVKGIHCADCATRIEKTLSQVEGVYRAVVSFPASKLKVAFDPIVTNQARIVSEVERLGYSAVSEEPTKDDLAGKQGKNGLFLLLGDPKTLPTLLSGKALVLGFSLQLLEVGGITPTVLYALAIIIGGYHPARAGLLSLRAGFSFDMNVLMIIAVFGAAAIGEWAEGATVIFLFSLGNALESYTLEKTRQSIQRLMDLSPNDALVRRGEEELRLPLEEIQVGDQVIIKPGERIPMDGEIIEGSTSVNEAPITGESLPVEKTVGDEVFAGTINQEGAVEIQVTKLVQDTTLARIIQLVEEAQEQRAPAQRYVDIFVRYYTPAVITLAVGIATIPPLLGAPFIPWFYRALTLLVVSCPCALVISTPVSVVSAIGNAARNGVLIKGGVYLEQSGAISAVAFDKTGTLTRGVPQVTDIIPFSGDGRASEPVGTGKTRAVRDGKGLTAEGLLSLAAAIEARSEHPLAEAIRREAARQGVAFKAGENFTTLTGRGARAEINGQQYYIGNLRLFTTDLGLDLGEITPYWQRLQEKGKTVILVGDGTRVLGMIAIADRVRETSLEAVQALRENGIKTIMLTGDNKVTARVIAGEIGIETYQAELMPEDKVRAIQKLQKKHRVVAMVGDGINDAPALAAASVGIAMGGAGTDTALETADIALMGDDPMKIPYLVGLSRQALRIIKQNIAFSLSVKLAAVALIFPGLLNLWLAILADTGASLLVILNGMRLLRFRVRG